MAVVRYEIIDRYLYSYMLEENENLTRVDPSVDYNAALQWASRNGHIKVVNRLLKDGILFRVDPSADNNFAIQSASFNGYIELVNKLLEDPRVDPSARDNLAIREASRNGHIEVVNRLLEDPRVDPSARDNEAIRWTSSKDHIEVVNRLLEDPRVYNNDSIKIIFKKELEIIREIREIKVKIMDEMGLPEDLILYEVLRY
jgi:hypothetical protein